MKQYRNSERTKKWIRRAFIELIAEKKSINKITINELAERADITKNDILLSLLGYLCCG